jgi:hypothetical protein
LIATTLPEIGEKENKAVNFQLLLLFGSAKPKSLLSWAVGRSVRPKPQQFYMDRFVAGTEHFTAWSWLRNDFNNQIHLLSVFAFSRGEYTYITREREA